MYLSGRTNEGFDEQYHCFSGAFADKMHLEEGDKVLLPSSAFEQLARLQIEYPMLFELQSSKGRTHCGVLEFTAPEGNCYVPFWMMQNLMLEEGGVLSVKNVSLPKATFVRFKPQSADFLDISNPRAICLPYNDKRYYLEVQEVKPSKAACIIECDCNVEFDAPVGYNESDSGAASKSAGEQVPSPQKAQSIEHKNKVKLQAAVTFKAFAGGGQRVDGKELKSTQADFFEAMPNPQSSGNQAKIWQSPGMRCSGVAVVDSTTMTVDDSPARPIFRKPLNNKWAKTSKAAFSGNGKVLK